MQPHDVKGKRVVIWGTGREGLAAAALIRDYIPEQSIVFVDEARAEHIPGAAAAVADPIIRDADEIAQVINHADIIVKSPGVSLYHPLIVAARARGAQVTSLLNMWFAWRQHPRTICVTGTKGKSTTSSLINHVLCKCGIRSALIGNIGVPVTSIHTHDLDTVVIEVSSYQAANFDGVCDIGVITSLYPEHLDWHRSLEVYYRDKLHLIAQSKTKVVNAEAWPIMKDLGVSPTGIAFSNTDNGFHVRGQVIYYGDHEIGSPPNRYLCSSHNLKNVATALAVLRECGVGFEAAMAAMHDFNGLPHRQFELGTIDRVLYVDDSISTTPQSAIAALENYKTHATTILLGGYDRGIDYTPLVDYLRDHVAAAIICMGPSGQRIYDQLIANGCATALYVTSMVDAVRIARERTPDGGVVLLSPAAPSYDQYKDFTARGQAFAALCGFDNQAAR